MEGMELPLRILMIEDDKNLCQAVCVSLATQGYEVDHCLNGEDGLHYALQSAYDLILLDRMLPGMDGLQVLGALRSHQITTPVIMVTAMDGIGDRVKGLDGGADDYLVKPFAMEELFARIRALFRRPQQYESSSQLAFGDISFDLEQNLIQGKKSVCILSKREGQLFAFFLRNAGQILPRALLLSRVWGPDAPVEDGNLDNYVHFLRRRLTTVGSSLRITTIRAVGYRMEQP